MLEQTYSDNLKKPILLAWGAYKLIDGLCQIAAYYIMYIYIPKYRYLLSCNSYSYIPHAIMVWLYI